MRQSWKTTGESGNRPRGCMFQNLGFRVQAGQGANREGGSTDRQHGTRETVRDQRDGKGPGRQQGTCSAMRLVSSAASRRAMSLPYTLHPTPYTLHPTPCTLHPTPYTLHPAPYTLHPPHYTLHSTPSTLDPKSFAPNPTTYTLQRVGEQGPAQQ